MKYNENKKYFDKDSKVSRPYLWYAIGFLFFLMGLVVHPIILWLIALVFINFGVNAQIKTQVLDKAAKAQLKKVHSQALIKLGINNEAVKEIPPIVFDGYIYNDAMVKKGIDGKYRSDKYKALVFFFSSNEIYCYSYEFSLTSDVQNETTYVFQYRDIESVSLQTEHASTTIEKNTSFDYTVFKLAAKDGKSLACTVNIAKKAQNSVKNMLAIIEQKKHV